jgi:hypothetical protein
VHGMTTPQHASDVARAGGEDNVGTGVGVSPGAHAAAGKERPEVLVVLA